MDRTIQDTKATIMTEENEGLGRKDELDQGQDVDLSSLTMNSLPAP